MHSAATTRAQRYKYKIRSKSEELWNGYADDTTLYAETKEALSQSLQTLTKIYQRYKFTLNIGKTKSMIYNWSPDSENEIYPKSILKLNSKDIDNEEKFRFLGSDICYNETTTGETEINSRIESAKTKFAEYRTILLNYNIKLKTLVSNY